MLCPPTRPITIHMKYNAACHQPACFLIKDDMSEEEQVLEELQVRECGCAGLKELHVRVWGWRGCRCMSVVWAGHRVGCRSCSHGSGMVV